MVTRWPYDHWLKSAKSIRLFATVCEINIEFDFCKRKQNFKHKPVYFEKDFFPKPLVIRISDRLLLKVSSMRPISNIIQPIVYVHLLINYKGVGKKLPERNLFFQCFCFCFWLDAFFPFFWIEELKTKQIPSFGLALV